ncbi:MAG TPA: DUF4416 family protein [Synergistaceae bacterium]|nr:DUF4416 family protein [Synergistaceae bacterium]HPJ25484.1 DUF4416 family protein [Synergistaceae bacterium]HPQ36210.1 DUF4416 family protein [Synergistaceae bacterium]
MKGKLIVGILYDGSVPLWEWTIGEIEPLWGEIEHVSEIFPFPHTCYYKDIGDPLYRRFLSFKGFTEGSLLWERKIQAIALEKKSGNPRKVNVDPGLLDGARLILASTKDRAQRIPISDTLYAEVTLRYKGRKWVPFDYTFPDFRGPLYYPFLENLRKDFLREMRTMKEAHA